jgi:site-specific DNA-methyltransferase (cytosine-N4-specific)
MPTVTPLGRGRPRQPHRRLPHPAPDPADPPYWQQRDYDDPAQIGSGSLETYYTQLADVFDEIKRLLTADGTLWLVLGATFAGAGGYCVRPTFVLGILETAAATSSR